MGDMVSILKGEDKKLSVEARLSVVDHLDKVYLELPTNMMY